MVNFAEDATSFFYASKEEAMKRNEELLIKIKEKQSELIPLINAANKLKETIRSIYFEDENFCKLMGIPYDAFFSDDMPFKNYMNNPEKCLPDYSVKEALLGATATGTASSIGLWQLVSELGTASTGTSIGSIYGAAASNATWAWFGNGSLATGGFGMLGGKICLGSIFAIMAIPGFLSVKNIQEKNNIEKENGVLENLLASFPSKQEINVLVGKIKEADLFIEKSFQEFKNRSILMHQTFLEDMHTYFNKNRLLECQENSGQLSLIQAVVSKKGKEFISDLLKNECSLNEKDDQGKTALMYAAIFGDLEIVELLIKAGVNLEERDPDGKTALILAAEKSKSVDVVYALCEAGAKKHYTVGKYEYSLSDYISELN